jgi:predicted small metal-binding protein
VTKVLRCQDTGIVCGAEVTGESEAEVLEQAVEHAREKHGVDLTSSTTLTEYARSAIRDKETTG